MRPVRLKNRGNRLYVRFFYDCEFIEDGQTKTDRSLYLLGYSLHPRMLRGAKVELEGLSLARRGVSGDLQAAADNLWSAK